MPNARAAALKALLRVEGQEGYSNLVLNAELDAMGADPLDRSLATAIFYGVLERRLTLDYIIGFFSKIPVKKLSPAVREILRIGLYQIRFLEKIPPSAAVNESVNLARRNGAARSAGFVNAVLRSYLRAPGRAAFPDRDREPLRYRSVFYSCPEELIAFWQGAYGESVADGILESLLCRPSIFARVNNTKVSEEQLIKRLAGENVKAVPAPFPENAVRLDTPGSLPGTAAYRDGLFHVQDLSSQLCCRVLGPKPGERVLDVCAAPGGKSFTLAELMENRGEILAFDKYESRTELIRQGAARLGLSIIRAQVRDAAADTEKEDPAPADRVLCDVPCSGLGVLRRKPEIRYKFPSALDSLPDLQYRILCRSSRLVKPGGVLLYSTCTLNPAENSGVAGRFLTEHRDFSPLSLPLQGPAGRLVPEPDNQLTLFPQACGTDGFFISAFRRLRP